MPRIHRLGWLDCAACAGCAARGRASCASDGRAGSVIDQLVLYCAPLQLSGSSGSYSVSLGTVVSLPPIGGNGGSAFPREDCPPDQVARGSSGQSGDLIDALAVTCSTQIVVVE
jgi:hypothetical protein